MARQKKPMIFEWYINTQNFLNDKMSHNLFVISNYLDEIDTLIIKKNVSSEDKLKRIKTIVDRIRELSVLDKSEYEELGIELDFLEDDSITEE